MNDLCWLITSSALRQRPYRTDEVIGQHALHVPVSQLARGQGVKHSDLHTLLGWQNSGSPLS